MPDATEALREWLVEYRRNGEPTFEHIASREDAIGYLRLIIAQGGTATLYQIVPFEVQIGVTVKAPRKRRKTPSPADKPGSDTPTGPGNGEAGEPKGAAPSDAPREGQDSNPPPVERRTVGTETFASPNLASPVYDCEARLDSAPACPGPVERDSVTYGWFCPLHIGIPVSGRRELHSAHKYRNRPVRVAHAG